MSGTSLDGVDLALCDLDEGGYRVLAAETVPYSAVTESVANGLLISAFPLFEGAGFSGDVYLGAIGNSARSDAVLRYIDYLTSP